MDEFKKLLHFLELELENQKKLLKVLAEEQVAIVKVNQQEIEAVNDKKAALLADARELEAKRSHVISSLVPTQNPRKRIKLADIAAECPAEPVKERLSAVGSELKSIALSVQEMNKLNADLVKQSLGLITTTLTIMTSGAVSDLPTYGRKGALTPAAETTLGRSRTTA